MSSNQAYRTQTCWDGHRFLIYPRSLLSGAPEDCELLKLDYPKVEVKLALPEKSIVNNCYGLTPREALRLFLPYELTPKASPDTTWVIAFFRWTLGLLACQRWYPDLKDGKISINLLCDDSSGRESAKAFQASMPPSFRAASNQTSLQDFWASLLQQTGNDIGWSLLEENRDPLSEVHLQRLPWSYRNILSALATGRPDIQENARFFDPRQATLGTSQQTSSLTFQLIAPTGERDQWELRPQLRSTRDPGLAVDALGGWLEPSTIPSGLIPAGVSPRFHLLQEFGRVLKVFPDLGAGLASSPPRSLEYTTEEMNDFLSQKAEELQGFGYALVSTTELSRPWSPEISLEVQPETPGLDVDRLLDFEWSLAVDETLLNSEQLEAWRENPTPLFFSDGVWFRLDTKSTLKALKFLDNQPRRGTLLEAMSLSGGGQALRLSYGGKLSPLNKSQKFRELSEPEGFAGKLREYQRRGFSWLMFMQNLGLGACLADDMGLGKTVQTLALLCALKEAGDLQPALLVCPTSVLGNWERELEKFAPHLKFHVHHGDRIKDLDEFSGKVAEVDVLLSSYPLLTRDRKLFLDRDWALIVLDEAQQIKNPNSQVSKVSKSLQANSRLILTGTPVENRLQDLWTLFRFLQPELLDSRRRFQTRFGRPIELHGDAEAKAQLKQVVSPFILRRTKVDPQIAAELPDKLETTVECSLTVEQAKLYESEVREALTAVSQETGFHRKGLILRLLTRLKQLCNHPALLEEKEPNWDLSRSGKLQRLVEIIDDLPSSEGVLIFSQFSSLVTQLQVQLIESFDEEVLALKGSTPKDRRDKLVTRYQSGLGPRLFCISLKAGGVGINLTRASTVIHVDRWWNPAVEAQATDRAFRIGQKNNVQVFKFVTQGTLEEQIARILEQKKTLAEGLIQDGDNWLTELSDRDLSELLLPDQVKAGEQV